MCVTGMGHQVAQLHNSYRMMMMMMMTTTTRRRPDTVPDYRKPIAFGQDGKVNRRMEELHYLLSSSNFKREIKNCEVDTLRMWEMILEGE